ncbi:alpha/beta hydrolase [Actinomadura graeca]|uniref:Alpha/beta hydrolase n=1 Tax=Actinomadura graeca TaxID=2750812 RepID=A0ABX8QXH2_9ACTN|nr:alpha/beta hydrolase [Actinomadura graeca]QXJ23490.1 alpha/beta hydrolase [Actinomadura graeca]
MTIRSATLAVPDAELYYEVTGAGPVLMIGQSGEGDARRTTAMAERLAEHYTVVTYDRRGLSRTVVADPSAPVPPETHAEDLHHLLAALTDKPAFMLGCSLGALYGLHLAVAHPGQLSLLIAHDVAAPGLLPPADRARIGRTLATVETTARGGDWRRAIAMVAAATGLDPGRMKTESGVTTVAMTDDRAANMTYYLTNDVGELRRSTLGPDEVAIASKGTRIISAAGADSKNAWNHQCAEVLAALLGLPLVEFPGGHNGNTAFPHAFAARVHALLSADDHRDHLAAGPPSPLGRAGHLHGRAHGGDTEVE